MNFLSRQYPGGVPGSCNTWRMPLTYLPSRYLRMYGSKPSSAGRPENIVVFTSQLRDGSLFYAVAVAPRGDFPAYSRIFDQVIRSIRLIG